MFCFPSFVPRLTRQPLLPMVAFAIALSSCSPSAGKFVVASRSDGSQQAGYLLAIHNDHLLLHSGSTLPSYLNYSYGNRDMLAARARNWKLVAHSTTAIPFTDIDAVRVVARNSILKGTLGGAGAFLGGALLFLAFPGEGLLSSRVRTDTAVRVALGSAVSGAVVGFISGLITYRKAQILQPSMEHFRSTLIGVSALGSDSPKELDDLVPSGREPRD